MRFFCYRADELIFFAFISSQIFHFLIEYEADFSQDELKTEETKKIELEINVQDFF